MSRAFLAVLLVGCGASRSIILKPAENRHASSVEIAEAGSTVDVPEDMRQYFKEQVEKRLYGEAKFVKGSDLMISYRFTQYDAGSQLSRWLWGGIGNSGEGSITVEAKFVDEPGTELALIQAEGKIGSGMFGGGFKNAVERAAEQVARYAVEHFGKSVEGATPRVAEP